MSDSYDDGPIIELPGRLDPPEAADAASADSEIDFDDETDDDQLLLDVREARESGVLLGDPERLDEEGA